MNASVAVLGVGVREFSTERSHWLKDLNGPNSLCHFFQEDQSLICTYTHGGL